MTPVYDDMGDEMIQDLELRHEQTLVGDEARLTAEALRVKFGIAAESVARAQMELADDDSLRQHWKATLGELTTT